MRAARWMGLVAALLVLGGGSGCPTEPQPCFGGTAPPQRPVARVFSVGREVSFDVSADLLQACDADGVMRRPESVTVEVKDPENRPVPATAVLGPGGAMATIRFTGTVEGRHHVIVSFSPVGSLQQLGVFILADRRGEPAMARLPPFTSCSHLDRTARGTWVCGSQAWRDSEAAPQSLGGSRSTTVVAGDVVWTVDGETVRRHVDTGTGPLEPTGTAPFPPGAAQGGPYPAHHSRLATPDELVVLSDMLLHRYTFTEAGDIATEPTTRWLGPGALAFGGDSVSGLLLRTGTGLLLVSRNQDPRTFEVRAQACPFRVGAGGSYVPVSNEACQALPGDPVGYEDGVLWTRTFATSTSVMMETLHRFTLTGGRLEESGAVALEGQLVINVPPLRPGPALPHLGAHGAFEPFAMPRSTPVTGRVELELAPTVLGRGLPGIGERFVWLNISDGSGIAVYPRSSTR